MKKKSSIVKLSIIGVLIAIGLVFSFCPINLFGFKKLESFSNSIKQGLDLNGGIYAVYEADESEVDLDSRILDTKDSLYELLENKGYRGTMVFREGNNRLRLEVPDFNNPQSLLEAIGQPADLVISVQSSGKEIVTNANVIDAGYSYYNGSYVVTFNLDSAGKKAVSANSKEVLTAVTTVAGTPTTQTCELINGSLLISGISSQTEAEKLANQILGGTFAVGLTLKEFTEISPSLGNDTAKLALIAGIIGLVLIMAFMAYRYRLLGAVAIINLLFQGILMLFFWAVFPWIQLSLPAIIAFIIGVGIAVDGSVLLFERIKEEYHNGKSIIASNHYGFKRSLVPTVDAAIIAAMVAIAFWSFPTGTMKAFGATLFASLAISSFFTLIFSRKLMKYFIAIWGSQPSRFALERSAEFAGLGASETADTVQKEIEEELKERARIQKEKESDVALDLSQQPVEEVEVETEIENGGLQDENN